MLAWSLLPAEVGNLTAFLLLGTLSAMLVSVAKAGFGGSIGLLSVPLMILACEGDAFLANGIMLPLLIACDYVAVGSWWGKWSWRPVGLLLPGAAAGIGVGWVALWAMQRMGGPSDREGANAALMLAVGAIALAFVGLQTARALRGRPRAFRPRLWQGTGAGLAAGVTSTLAHAAGPITTMYMLPQQMPKGQYVATTVLYYWIGNQLKLVPYFALGILTPTALAGGLVFLPAVVVGTLLGILLHRKVGERSFTSVVYVLLALAGVQLVAKALPTLWL